MGITKWRRHGKVSWRIEFKWQDMWLGLFVQRPELKGGMDLFVCVVPMFPIHIARFHPVEANVRDTYGYAYRYVDAQGNSLTWDDAAKKWSAHHG